MIKTFESQIRQMGSFHINFISTIHYSRDNMNLKLFLLVESASTNAILGIHFRLKWVTIGQNSFKFIGYRS